VLQIPKDTFRLTEEQQSKAQEAADRRDETKSDIYRDAVYWYLDQSQSVDGGSRGYGLETELLEFVYAVWTGDLHRALEKGDDIYGEVEHRYGEALAHMVAEKPRREWNMDIDRYLEQESR